MPPQRLLALLCTSGCSLLACAPVYAQVPNDTLWFDSELKRVTDKARAYYYRTPRVKTDTGYRITDYDRSGRLRMIGYATTPDETMKTGYRIFYDSLGYKSSEGTYRKGMRNGTWLFYFHGSRRLRAEEQYYNDMLHGRSRLYDSVTGKLRLEGEWEMNRKSGTWSQYYTGTDRLYRVGPYKNGLRDGPFKCYYMDGNIKRIDYYEAGRLTSSGKCYDPAGKSIRYTPFTVDPAYSGNLQQLADRIVYRPGFRKQVPNPDNTWFYMTVFRDGRVGELDMQDPKHPISAYLPRLIAAMNRWQPMRIDGQPVASRLSCFIRITEDGASIKIEAFPLEDWLSPEYSSKKSH